MKHRETLWLLGFLALACGGAPPSQGKPPAASLDSASIAPSSKALDEAPPESVDGQKEADAPSSAPGDSGGVESNVEESSASPAGKSLEAEIAQRCTAYCQRKANECEPEVSQRCFVDCKRYRKTAAPCDKAILDALSCAEKQAELFCASVISGTCGLKFAAYTTCLDQGSFEEVAGDTPKVPAGFAKRNDRELGFSVLMPKGAQLKDEGGKKLWTVEQGPNLYQVGRFDAPKGGAKNARVLKAANDYVGACNKMLKLRGNIEKEDYLMMQFSSECKEGGGYAGTMRLRGDHIYVASVKYTSSLPKEADAFIYSFEFLK